MKGMNKNWFEKILHYSLSNGHLDPTSVVGAAKTCLGRGWCWDRGGGGEGLKVPITMKPYILFL